MPAFELEKFFFLFLISFFNLILFFKLDIIVLVLNFVRFTHFFPFVTTAFSVIAKNLCQIQDDEDFLPCYLSKVL